MGRRVRKVASSGASSTVLFVYDQDGQILGEYSPGGNALREYVWLGSTPVAMFTPDPTPGNPPLVYFIHADHIDTPRIVVDRSNNLRWRWIAEPFGTTAPETNPQILGAFTQNLRFPGQYFDQESGLHYNMARYYGPGEGRYAQSDPIGLDGGINTYAYVGGQPNRFTDPLGLWSTAAHNFFIDNLRVSLTQQQRDWMKEGSLYTDRWAFQDGTHSYMHAMSSQALPKSAAQAKWCEFVQSKIAAFKRQRQSKDPRMQQIAYFNLGMALHAAMDSTSPSHRGFQHWHNSTFNDHGDFPGSMETVTVARFFKSETDALMIQVMAGQLPEFCSCQ